MTARIGKAVTATRPNLSVYTNGMYQTWHNDPLRGRAVLHTHLRLE